jgi:hypothetical protein
MRTRLSIPVDPPAQFSSNKWILNKKVLPESTKKQEKTRSMDVSAFTAEDYIEHGILSRAKEGPKCRLSAMEWGICIDSAQRLGQLSAHRAGVTAPPVLSRAHRYTGIRRQSPPSLASPLLGFRILLGVPQIPILIRKDSRFAESHAREGRRG